MIAGLLIDQTGNALPLCPETPKNYRAHEKGRDRQDAVCCRRATIQPWGGFRYRRFRQYPFCRSDMYFSVPRRIYLRPPAAKVETYC